MPADAINLSRYIPELLGELIIRRYSINSVIMDVSKILRSPTCVVGTLYVFSARTNLPPNSLFLVSIAISLYWKFTFLPSLFLNFFFKISWIFSTTNSTSPASVSVLMTWTLSLDFFEDDKFLVRRWFLSILSNTSFDTSTIFSVERWFSPKRFSFAPEKSLRNASKFSCLAPWNLMISWSSSPTTITFPCCPNSLTSSYWLKLLSWNSSTRM